MTWRFINFLVEGLWEEEVIRGGHREQRKKSVAGGSGSGDLDSVAHVILSYSTVLYPDATTTSAATTLGAPTTGDCSVWISHALTQHTLPDAGNACKP